MGVDKPISESCSDSAFKYLRILEPKSLSELSLFFLNMKIVQFLR